MNVVARHHNCSRDGRAGVAVARIERERPFNELDRLARVALLMIGARDGTAQSGLLLSTRTVALEVLLTVAHAARGEFRAATRLTIIQFADVGI